MTLANSPSFSIYSSIQFVLTLIYKPPQCNYAFIVSSFIICSTSIKLITAVGTVWSITATGITCQGVHLKMEGLQNYVNLPSNTWGLYPCCPLKINYVFAKGQTCHFFQWVTCIVFSKWHVIIIYNFDTLLFKLFWLNTFKLTHEVNRSSETFCFHGCQNFSHLREVHQILSISLGC